MKYTTINNLSRRSRIKSDDTDEKYVEDINDFITI